MGELAISLVWGMVICGEEVWALVVGVALRPLIRPGLRRATFPAGKGFWGVPAPLSVFFWALALAVVFAVLPLIRQPFGLPPSPEGEGFGAAQPRMCYGKPTWSAGAASALRTVYVSFVQIIEP